MTHPFELEWLIGTSRWLYPCAVIGINLAVWASIIVLFLRAGIPESLWARITVLGGALVLLRSPFLAADLRLSPDSVEYAIGSARLVKEGIYALPLNHLNLPPRYAPWFSGLIIAPAYFFSSLGLGAGVLLVWLYALVLLVAIVRIGELLGGKHVAVLAGVLLLVTPNVRGLSREVLTDIPSLSMVSLLGLFYLIVLQKSFFTRSESIAVGMVVVWAVAMRPLSFMAILPLGYEAIRKRQPGHIILQVLPTIVLGVCTLLYQKAVFNDLWRSGYQYWSSVPYDFFQLLFSWHYIGANLNVLLLQTGAPILFIAAWASYRVLPRESVNAEHMKNWCIFSVTVALPLLLFFLFYFFSASRLMLPIGVLCIPPAALAISVLRERAKISAGAISISLSLLTILCGVGLAFSDQGKKHSEILESLRQQSAQDTVIISAINPAQVSYVLGPDYEVLPISRSVEYASKVVAEQTLVRANPTPDRWDAHRAKSLWDAGAKEVFEDTAVDSLKKIQSFIRQGRPVLLETRFSAAKDVQVLEKHFVFIPLQSDIVQLVERSGFRSEVDQDYSMPSNN